MNIIDISNHLADKLIEAIKTHDDGLRKEERVTSAKYDEEIEYDGDGLIFALPFKFKNKNEPIRVKLKFEFECDELKERNND